MILAGIYISIACMAYRACGNHLAGSAAFSVGLILVCLLDAKLFTGKVGYAKRSKRSISQLVSLLLLNCGSAVVMGLIFPGNAPAKLGKPIHIAFASAVLCGMLVFAAVEGYRRTGKLGAIGIPTATFVLICGKHCVADAFWISAAGVWSWYAVLWLAVVALGNTVGALAVRFSLKGAVGRENHPCGR